MNEIGQRLMEAEVKGKKVRYTVLVQTVAYDEWARILWSDAEKREAVRVVYDTLWQHNAFWRRLHKLHLFSRLPGRRLWIGKYLSDMDISKEEQNYIFISDINICMRNPEFAPYLKMEYGARVILFILNPLKRKGKKGYVKGISVSRLKKWYDLVITIDPRDAEDFDLGLIPAIYSRIETAEKREIKRDLIFVGREKGREGLLEELHHLLRSKNVNTEFDICGQGEDKGAGWEYISYIPYGKIIRKSLEANCILEILQEGQTGITQRTMEALAYNKKLLTNNKNLKNMPFYNGEYMQIFERPEEIRIDFITERVPVDYGYRDEYSSGVFLDRAVRLLQEKEQGAEAGKYSGCERRG